MMMNWYVQEESTTPMQQQKDASVSVFNAFHVVIDVVAESAYISMGRGYR